MKIKLFLLFFALAWALRQQQAASKPPAPPTNGSWVAGNNDDFPSSALVIGYEFGGEPLYLGRGNHSGTLFLGKYRQALGGVEVGYDNKDIVMTNYSLLTGINGYWNRTSYMSISQLEARAIVGSLDPDQKPSYIGRVHYQGGLHPVRIAAGYGQLGYGGKHLRFKTYEILLRPKEDWKPLNGTKTPTNSTVAFKNKAGDNVFISQSYYRGNLVPGQYVEGADNCTFGYGSRGHKSSSCYMLINPGNFTWIKDRFGVIHPNAVVGGHLSTLEPLFICRAIWRGERVVGKIRPTFSGCDVAPKGSQQLRVHQYEVLVAD